MCFHSFDHVKVKAKAKKRCTLCTPAPVLDAIRLAFNQCNAVMFAWIAMQPFLTRTRQCFLGQLLTLKMCRVKMLLLPQRDG